MSFISKRVLEKDEQVLHHAKLHPIYVAKGIGYLIILSALALGPEFILTKMFGPAYAHGEPLAILGELISPMFIYKVAMVAGGLWLFLVYLIKFLDSEVAVTDQRIIYKYGWILVKIDEIDLDETINEEKVDHGLFGRFFDYGTILLDCRFVKDLNLPAVRHPHKVISALNDARRNLIQH